MWKLPATLLINLSADRSDLFCRLDYTGSCVRDGSRLWINSRTNQRTSRKLKQRSFLPVRGLVLYSKKITGKRAKPAGKTYLGADQRLLWKEIVVNWQISTAQFPEQHHQLRAFRFLVGYTKNVRCLIPFTEIVIGIQVNISKIYIWTADKDMKTWLIIAVIHIT